MYRKRIKTAVIGVGYLGRLHAQKYATLEGSELAGVFDSDAARAASVAEEFKTGVFKDMNDVFGNADAVSIVTPTEHHFRLGMEALSKGVHVMMEKPITTTVEEARALVAEAEKTGAVLQVGHLERFNGAMCALGSRVKDPVYIEAFRLSPFPNRSTDVDVVLDLMIHDIDLVLMLAASEPVSVEAVGVPVVMPGKADFASARVLFENGCVANLTASRVSKERARKINIFQKDSIISIDYGAQALTVTNTVAGAPGSLNSQVDEDVAVEKKDAILEELRSFLDSIATGRPPAVSGADGLRALELAERVQKAFTGKRPVGN